MSELHADYLAVDESHRWGRPLNELFPQLRREAWEARGAWRYRVLPHGALVSVRVVPPEEGKESAFLLELRIARKQPPADEKGWQSWSRELAVFLRSLTGEEGDWEETKRVPEKADATFRFRVRQSVIVCVRCRKRPAVDVGKYKEDICTECATELGAEEASELNASHQRELL